METTTQPKTSYLLARDIFRTYAAAEAAQLAAKNEIFPDLTVVIVSHPRYHGDGIVRYEDGTPPGDLAVMLCNGNVWRYPVIDCKPIPLKDAAHWVRPALTKLKRR